MNNLNKLRWRCRRGTLELDLMLLRYLETRFFSAGNPEQQAFLSVLELEDTELMQYLTGERNPADPALAAVFKRIRCMPVVP